MMIITRKSLVVKLCSKDTQFGATRVTLKAWAQALGVNEAQAIHLARSMFAADSLQSYVPDGGPQTAKQVEALRQNADMHLPKGKTLSTEVLFA